MSRTVCRHARIGVVTALLGALLVVAGAGPSPAAPAGPEPSAEADRPATSTFTECGGPHTYFVPPDTYSIQVEVYGAQGGRGDLEFSPVHPGMDGGWGGGGGARIPVEPDESLRVYIGCQGEDGDAGSATHGATGGDGGSGSLPGHGGDGGDADNPGGGGGGGSAVLRGINALVVAGGGGGGGSGVADADVRGGAGGGVGMDGADGHEEWAGCRGRGGTTSTGGAAGTGNGGTGSAGTGGGGGDAANTIEAGITTAGGGGGGGAFGGGGAGHSGGLPCAGGGGGSGYLAAGTYDAGGASGVIEGDGWVEIRDRVAHFSDVVYGDHPFFSEIEWMASRQISTGYPDGTYKPGDPVSRQAMSAFMYRLAGSPAFTAPGTPTFDDVPLDHPFYDEIEWMADEEITGGYPDGGFHPSDAVSRQAMSAFMYRLAGSPAFTAPGTPTFDDVPTGHPFYDEVEWMADEEISEGYPPGPTYRPAAAVSRQAMSAFMLRLSYGPGVGI